MPKVFSVAWQEESGKYTYPIFLEPGAPSSLPCSFDRRLWFFQHFIFPAMHNLGTNHFAKVPLLENDVWKLRGVCYMCSLLWGVSGRGGMCISPCMLKHLCFQSVCVDTWVHADISNLRVLLAFSLSLFVGSFSEVRNLAAITTIHVFICLTLVYM